MQRLLDREALLGLPGRSLVDRPQDTGADPGERVELLDRRVRAVRDERARVPERAERVRAVDPVGPEALGEVAIRRRVAELDGAGDAERREAADVLRCEALRVLDAVAQAERRPHVARRLEGVERLAVRPVADRVHADGPAQPRARADDVGELVAARDHDARAVEHPRGLRAERPVHERLQVADPEEVVADPGAEAQRLELGQPLVRDATARRAA